MPENQFLTFNSSKTSASKLYLKHQIIFSNTKIILTRVSDGCHAVPVRRGAFPVLYSVRSAISAAGATVSQCDKKAFRCKIFL
jgi:hypothetical protein